MKFVLHWESRTGSSGRENLTDLATLVDVFGKWGGFGESVQVTEWVLSLADGSKGWLVCTTDDSDALMSACHNFVPWLNFTLTPVIDVQAGAGLMAASAAWVESQL